MNTVSTMALPMKLPLLFTGLAAGDYEVMVRDANLCTMGDLVTINEPAIMPWDFTATPTDVLCNGDASGEIDIIASEGTAPYEYSIDNGVTYETTALFTGLAAGDYDIMVRDANLLYYGRFGDYQRASQCLGLYSNTNRCTL